MGGAVGYLGRSLRACWLIANRYFVGQNDCNPRGRSPRTVGQFSNSSVDLARSENRLIRHPDDPSVSRQLRKKKVAVRRVGTVPATVVADSSKAAATRRNLVNHNGNGAKSVNGTNGKLPAHVNGHALGSKLLKRNGVVATASATVVVAANGHNGFRRHRQKPAAKGLIAQDRALVDLCIQGEPAAWSQLYDRLHGNLLASIRAFLGKAGQDIHLVDEVSARVWYSLIRNQFELLAKFDPGRGCRLSTFLSVLGKSEARLLLRSERRRKTRECVASRSEIEESDAEYGCVMSDDEFLATLSPRERSFYLDILVATSASPSDDDYSQQNQWQLRHRVRKKLEQFLE
jgi:DNA-directed RNA polymerase specialized sigma24 family protein